MGEVTESQLKWPTAFGGSLRQNEMIVQSKLFKPIDHC